MLPAAGPGTGPARQPLRAGPLVSFVFLTVSDVAFLPVKVEIKCFKNVPGINHEDLTLGSYPSSVSFVVFVPQYSGHFEKQILFPDKTGHGLIHHDQQPSGIMMNHHIGGLHQRGFTVD